MSDHVEEEDLVTMRDAVKEHEEQEEEAIAVLGAGDEQNCTYGMVSAFFYLGTYDMVSYNAMLINILTICNVVVYWNLLLNNNYYYYLFILIR